MPSSNTKCNDACKLKYVAVDLTTAFEEEMCFSLQEVWSTELLRKPCSFFNIL